MAVYFMYYNFARVHQTLRVTPAMEAGVSDHVWSIAEVVAALTYTSLTRGFRLSGGSIKHDPSRW